MTRKILLFLLTVMVFAGLMTAAAFAEGTAAIRIGDTEYGSLSEAVADANIAEGGARIELIGDVTLGEKLMITGDVTISGAHTLTRADGYSGTLFEVGAEGALTLDGGLVIDGGNEYVFDGALYEADLTAMNRVEDAQKYLTPEEGAPIAEAYMITASGDVELLDVTVRNHYSRGSGIVRASAGANVTLTGARILHCANVNGSGLVVDASAGIYDVNQNGAVTVTMNEGTVIDGNFVGGNHGIFKIYTGTHFIMNGGEIKNTVGWNSNGSAVGVYWGAFTMNGGTICSNSSVYGPNNGRNAAVYLHSASQFVMEGGTVCHNVGRARGGIDAPYTDGENAATAIIRGGFVTDNSSVNQNADKDILGGVAFVLTGGTYTQDVSALCAEHYGVIDNGDGSYTVVYVSATAENALASLEDEAGNISYHYTLKEAFDALPQNGRGRIRVLADQVIDTDMSSYAIISMYTKSITLDLNGRSVVFDYTAKTNSDVVYASIYVYASELTVVDSVGGGRLFNYGLDGVTPNESRIIWNATDATTVIEGGIFESDQRDTMFYTSTTASRATRKSQLLVRGGSFIQREGGDCFNMQDNSASWQYIELSGGRYNNDPRVGFQNSWEVTVAPDCSVIDNGDGTWSVIKTVAVRVEAEPQDAEIVITDAAGAVIAPTDDMTYLLIAGEVYSYTASAEGYITKTDSFTAEENLVVSITLYEVHEHLPSGEWLSDAAGHWHACLGCDEKLDFGLHTEGGWIVDEEATSKRNGSRHRACTLCGYVTVREVIPAAGSEIDYNYWYWMMMLFYNREFEISAAASEGGSVTPVGISKVKYDRSITYSITPDEGFEVADVLVDGLSVGARSEYSFTQVREGHSIHVIFVKKAWENPFRDVDEGDWYYEDVAFVSEKGLMVGTDAEGREFSPDGIVNRAMLVTVLWRLEGSPSHESALEFGDVPSGEWYSDAVSWASASGIVRGYGNGNFGPEDSLTHEQIMAILNRYAVYKDWSGNLSGGAVGGFICSEWAEGNILWADAYGMLEGIGSDISDLTEAADRAELAAYLRRFCEHFMGE